jgi:hypothetical protein
LNYFTGWTDGTGWKADINVFGFFTIIEIIPNQGALPGWFGFQISASISSSAERGVFADAARPGDRRAETRAN